MNLYKYNIYIYYYITIYIYYFIENHIDIYLVIYLYMLINNLYIYRYLQDLSINKKSDKY